MTNLQCLRRLVCLSASASVLLLLLAGCSYQAALHRLSADEQVDFRIYSKAMTPQQARTYLAHETAAERSAYLEQLGLQQRFQALAAEDRQLVLAGDIRPGMSPEAVFFLWGIPYKMAGNVPRTYGSFYRRGDAKGQARPQQRPGRYEDWYYLGSPLALMQSGNVYGDASTMVRVHFVDDRVVWWLEFVPEIPESSDNDRHRDRS
jgi:hypothetical protein